MNSSVLVDLRQTVMSMYVPKFGQLPEGLHKLMANMGLTQQMYQMMEVALSNNQPVIWNDYVERLLAS